jgi:dihydrofolate reductase
MTIVRAHMTTSLDGFVAGPNQSLDKPFGDGTDRLNDWMFEQAAVRKMFGEAGGATGPSNDVFVERASNIGAVVMGRNMFGGGRGPWATEPRWDGWWGEEPPYHAPVFVLTHYPRAPQPMKGGTTFHFVTDGIESALRQARGAAGDKDVVIAGGANVIQQVLRAGGLDLLELHLVPQTIGAGERLLDGIPAEMLEQDRVVPDRGVTHLRYRIRRS